MLNVLDPSTFDEGIEGIEFHTHYPFASTSLENGDEIVISIQHQDIYTLPWQSYIYMEGKFTKENNDPPNDSINLTNNAFAFLFDEIRYELNGVEIDRVRNLGLTSTMKGYLTHSMNDQHIFGNYGWVSSPIKYYSDISAEGYFNVCIPLAFLLSFADDHRKVIVNMKQDLILIRSRRDENCYYSVADEKKQITKAKIKLTKLFLRMPYVTVSPSQKLTLLRHLETGLVLNLNYRSWELYEYPLLPRSRNHIWSVKTTTQIEKPRYVIIGFQTSRKNEAGKYACKFDHCNLTNLKLFLNSKVYPYDDLNLDFTKGHFALLYHMYSAFRSSYYPNTEPSPSLSRADFGDSPLIVLDCSKQSDAIKTGSIDVRLEFESDQNFPANTAAYCLIIHNRVVEYSPFTGNVRRMM